MRDVIAEFENTKISCSEMRQDINSVIVSTSILKAKLKISHQEIDTAYCRNDDVSKLLENAKTKMLNLKDETDAIVESIKQDKTTRTETIIGDATTYIILHNDTLIHKIEMVFAENIQLMEDTTTKYDIESAACLAIATNMDTEVT